MSEIVRLRSLPLWDAVWPEDVLRQKQQREPRAFERGFRMKAFVDGEETFPSFRQCENPAMVLGDVQRSEAWPAFTGVDLAGKKRAGNAIVTLRVDPRSKRRYPIDVRFGAWRSSETAEQIEDVYRLYKPCVVMVEDNGYQRALLDWIADQYNRFSFSHVVYPTTTMDGNKSDHELGLPGLEIEFHNGAWSFPLAEYDGISMDDPDRRRAAWARLAYEFRHHPVAASSDGVMATWFARQGVEIWGGLAFRTDAGVGEDFNAR